MTVSKKLLELEMLLKKSHELSSKLSELNYDVDESEITNSTNDSKKASKDDIKIINKINYSIVAVKTGSSAQILHTVPVTSLADSASAVPNFIVTFGDFVVTVYGFVSA